MKTECWAIAYPSEKHTDARCHGGIAADPSWTTPELAWKGGLGNSPSPSDIEAAKKRGWRCIRVGIEEAKEHGGSKGAWIVSDITQSVPDTFLYFPKDAVCPVCKTNDDLAYWLMPIDGTTDENGITTEGQPVHMSCTGRPLMGRLRYSRGVGIVYARVDGV